MDYNTQEARTMSHEEMIEKLKNAAGVDAQEAERALEKNDWDLFDAMVALEREGKAAKLGAEVHTTAGASDDEPSAPQRVKNSAKEKTENGVGATIKKLLLAMVKTAFVVSRKDEELLRFPTLLLVLLALFGFWFTIPAMLIGMALGCRYRFEGRGETSAAANRAMDDIQSMVYSAREKVEQTVKENKNKAREK